MAEIKWTDEQKAAIYTEDKSIAVSAAAGSGKTSVLVERIVEKICNCEKPVKVEDLLVVTFTKAAANEMRERLYKELEERIALQPDNRWLLRQRSMLPVAEIRNMDQFFNALVRDNYHQLGITPDFRIIDDSEKTLIVNESLNECAEELYEQDSYEFRELLDILNCTGDDLKLTEIIYNLSKYSDSFINPDAWLDGIKEAYNTSVDIKDTCFGKVILDSAVKRLEYAAELFKLGATLCEGDDELVREYSSFLGDAALAENLKNLIPESSWDDIRNAFSGLKFSTFPAKKRNVEETEIRKMLKSLREKGKKLVVGIANTLVSSKEEYSDDMKKLYPVVSKLVSAVFRFREIYSLKKQEENAYDFSDILHLTIKLLVDENGEPSHTAKELQGKFVEILIDEYQDTNEAQDAVFCALSKQQTNLFLVGDIKQSIYGFRLAMPQVFIDKIDAWRDKKLETAEYICLDKNYRSRENVLECINYLFERTMTKETGDIDYNNEQSLKYGADYPADTDVPVEISVIEKSSLPTDYDETKYIADKVEDILATHFVYDKKNKTMRKAEPKDICVLFRSNAACNALFKELESRNLPAYYEVNSGFFESKEVQSVISLLKIIDNPLQDVPLLAALMSQLFGFTPDDVARLRISDKKSRLFYALEKSDDPKCKAFLSEYRQYKRLSTVLSVQELVRTIYDRTGFLSVVSALSNGEVRKLNLMLLLEYAAGYEENSNQGLSGFMRYIERCENSGTDFSPAVKVSDNAQVVRIMTIHKSKGLEFPFVILGSCGSPAFGINNTSLIISGKTGVGLMVCESESFKKYKTMQYQAAYIDALNSNCSEELRVLYVALTRAKEKLFIVGSIKSNSTVQSKLNSLFVNAYFKKMNSVEIQSTGSYLDLILKVYLRHRCSGELRKYMTYELPYINEGTFDCKFNIITEPLHLTEKVSDEFCRCEPNKQLLETVSKRTHFSYKYEPLSSFSTKKAASSFNKSENNELFFANATPEFTHSESLTAAEKGTAVHRFMEVCDFELAKNDVPAEIERLVSLGKLTQQQADVIDTDTINQFFESPLFKRIEASPKVLREQKFTLFVPISFSQPQLDEEFADEKILVQGVIDCAFFENNRIVVLDYKTDRVKSADELAELYTNQLHIYKLAAEKLFNTEVSQLLLYSFKLSEEKEIKI